jgi:hypothetical protein
MDVRAKGGILEAPAEERLMPPMVLPGDECDQGQCPSAVAVSVTLQGGRVLGFCGHHGSLRYREMIARGLRTGPLEKVL